jgi:sporulation protein YlmC with PRC-barrel domain
MTPIALSASTLIGDDVQNSKGEKLGKIEEIMLDLTAGRVLYAVLSFGGFLGIGDKLFAIPWEALIIDTAEEVVIFDIEKEVLEDAPGFDKDDWPAIAPEDDAWLVSVYEYYHYDPYWR